MLSEFSYKNLPRYINDTNTRGQSQIFYIEIHHIIIADKHADGM